MVLVIDGPMACADVPALCERIRALPQGCGTGVVVCDVSHVTSPDAGTVDALARLQLSARRLGHEIVLRHAGRELRELLDLTGLCEAVAGRRSRRGA